MEPHEFGNVAKRLSYNPLGIIALFIVLCYAIACLLFGLSVRTLDPLERWPIVWFVVFFPLIVLLLFVFLVCKHHTKLYAPKDFQDSFTYLKTLDIHEQRRKLDEKAEEVGTYTRPESSQAPDELRQGKTEIRNEIVLAEDLVMRDLQAEFEVVINRQVKFEGASFDGMFAKDGEAFVIEVKLTKRVDPQEMFSNAIEKFANFSKTTRWKRVHLILAIVSVGEPSIQLQTPAAPVSAPVMVRSYRLAELAKKYGVQT